MSKPPLSLYVHLPWCLKKCPYCDFNSHALKWINGVAQSLPQKDYIDQLLVDLQYDSDHFIDDPRPLQSIFIGGGTPSLFDPSQIYQLLEQIKKQYTFVHNIEITMEANPSTFEYQRFLDFKQAGVNRLSIGIQSFNQKHLQTLGRVHNSQEASKAIDIGLKCNFNQINVDLMYGLPQQSVTEALNDLKQALAFETPHLSWYQLTMEPNTPFYKSSLILPDENELWQMEQQGKALLQKCGFLQYEISAYAKQPLYDIKENVKSNQCQHNLNYWRFGDYLGIGCGAHGKLTLITENEPLHVIRTEKIRQPENYLQLESKLVKQQLVKHEDLAFEFFMNRFRLLEPCLKQKLLECTGVTEQEVAPLISQAVSKNFLIDHRDSWQITQSGTLFLNDLLEIFLCS